jgi:predicted RNA-binding Zn-ribbon protein involved in translation (DUF1610 family)
MIMSKDQTVEIKCPGCGYTKIVSVPKESIPVCPKCKKQMLIKEILREGKSY